MSLTSYSKKRNLSSSKEPSAKIKKFSNKKLIYVIQKHNALHLHWDLRLEFNGVLKSWAIPKEPPKIKGIKRLAIQVEDHPIEYANFQGKIPEGNYGAGTVKIWDKGTYELIEKDKKKIEIKINGKKLQGNFILIKTKYGNKPEKSWLFMKVS